jgi:hypothetical protein
MVEKFYVLGRGEVGAKIKVGEIDGAKESVVGDDGVEEDVDGIKERSDLGGGGAGRGKAVTTRMQYREHDGLRPSCSSAGGRGGGEKRGTTSPFVTGL